MTAPRRAASPGFEDFFRSAYRRLIAGVMYLGATKDEAEDAAAASMAEVLRRWEKISDPLAYAHKAARSNFFKERTRPLRLISRLVEQGEFACGYHEAGLTIWEDSQWVKELIDSLPPAQRDAMNGFMAQYSHSEVALLLGKEAAAVRQSFLAARRRLMLALAEYPPEEGR